MNVIENETGTELAQYERPEIAIAQYVTRTGLVDLPEDLPLENWRQLLSASKTFSDSVYWIVGDLANFGERHYGEVYAQFVDILGYAPETLQLAMRVARSIPLADRRPELPWSYHQSIVGLRKCQNPQHPYPAEVANCEDCKATMEMRNSWLETAVDQKWTRETLRTLLREAAGRENKRGRPAKAGGKKRKKPAITQADFKKLVNEDLEPALTKATETSEQFTTDAKQLLDDLGRNRRRSQDDFAGLARQTDELGARLLPLRNALARARGMAGAIASPKLSPIPNARPSRKHVCARPSCDNPIPARPKGQRGRPRKYCSTECQVQRWHDLHPRVNLEPMAAERMSK